MAAGVRLSPIANSDLVPQHKATASFRRVDYAQLSAYRRYYQCVQGKQRLKRMHRWPSHFTGATIFARSRCTYASNFSIYGLPDHSTFTGCLQPQTLVSRIASDWKIRFTRAHKQSKTSPAAAPLSFPTSLLQPNTHRVLDSFTLRTPPSPRVVPRTTTPRQPTELPADVQIKMVATGHRVGNPSLVNACHLLPVVSGCGAPSSPPSRRG